jgi:hypothetical protein
MVSPVLVDTAPLDAAMDELVRLVFAARPPLEFAETFRLAYLGLFDRSGDLRELVAEARPAAGAENWHSWVVFKPSRRLLCFLAALRAEDWNYLVASHGNLRSDEMKNLAEAAAG